MRVGGGALKAAYSLRTQVFDRPAFLYSYGRWKERELGGLVTKVDVLKMGTAEMADDLPYPPPTIRLHGR